MPGRSTAGATRASAEVDSGSGVANRRGSGVSSGPTRASETIGTYPSSRRRLVQKPASMSASIDGSSGGAAPPSMWRAKCSRTRSATRRRAGYSPYVIIVHPMLARRIAIVLLGLVMVAAVLVGMVKYTHAVEAPAKPAPPAASVKLLKERTEI